MIPMRSMVLSSLMLWSALGSAQGGPAPDASIHRPLPSKPENDTRDMPE